MRRRVACAWRREHAAHRVAYGTRGELHVDTSAARGSDSVAPMGERTRYPHEAHGVDVGNAAQIETDIHDRVGQRTEPSLHAGRDGVAKEADDIDRGRARVGFAGNLEKRHTPSGFAVRASSPECVTPPVGRGHATVTLRERALSAAPAEIGAIE